MKETISIITRIILVLCGIAFVCSLYWQKEYKQKQEERQTIKSTAGFSVLVETNQGVVSYDPEEVLMPMMRAMLPEEGQHKVQELTEHERQELWKVLSIVCRTNLVKEWEENGRKQELILPKEFFEIDTKEWNKERKDENDIRKAIAATKGIILCFQEQTIEAAFCYATTGQTRNAEEIFGDDRYPYLISVPCEEDKNSTYYFAQHHLQKDVFFQKMQTTLFGENVSLLQDKDELRLEELIFEKESTGYVQKVGYEKEQIWIDATSFQELFGLQSPHFQVEERETQIVITTKGIGHGLGLSIYQVICMADEGKSMEEILAYFYAGVTLEKKYV